jgi:hypothetical protein
VDKIPEDGEYTWVKLDDGELWPHYVGFKNIDLPDYPTQQIEPIDSDPLSPARGIVRGLLYSLPIWVAAGFVLWAVGRGKGWW